MLLCVIAACKGERKNNTVARNSEFAGVTTSTAAVIPLGKNLAGNRLSPFSSNSARLGLLAPRSMDRCG